MGMLQPINIFLRQEIDRMQKVITLVRTTLSDLKLAIDGTIIMSENLRDALDNMFDARVPTNWKKISWESATLGFWFTDLLDRNQQFSTWLFEGRPTSFWMTGFFNPQVRVLFQSVCVAVICNGKAAKKAWFLRRRSQLMGQPPCVLYMVHDLAVKSV